MPILIHYGELALKGRNRILFEKRLIENIKKGVSGRVIRLQGRLLAESDEIVPVGRIFGISWFAPVYTTEKDLESIKKATLETVKERVKDMKTFGVYVKRADKGFPYTSVEVAKIVGEEIRNTFKLKVDLREPDLPIYIEIADQVFVFFEKMDGLGGLPVGISGRVLCLLSGGIDSPVAAYLMMKRGCNVDFIHFHSFNETKPILQSKVKEIVLTLKKYQAESRLFLIPFIPFQIRLLENYVPQGYELVLFRRYMVKVAERVAKLGGHKALVTGDSLGQVASQTLENLFALKDAVSMPILQPLISYDKQEIIDLSKRIGTYELSIKPYKDCCSIISSRPNTKAKMDLIRRIEQELDLDTLVEKTSKDVDEFLN
ncbi:MAG: tRNA uracil 4-sulfurtransferase ThiI [Thermodesulfobacteriota bacterium]